jgi:hypothetical protein
VVRGDGFVKVYAYASGVDWSRKRLPVEIAPDGSQVTGDKTSLFAQRFDFLEVAYLDGSLLAFVILESGIPPSIKAGSRASLIAYGLKPVVA